MTLRVVWSHGAGDDFWGAPSWRPDNQGTIAADSTPLPTIGVSSAPYNAVSGYYEMAYEVTYFLSGSPNAQTLLVSESSANDPHVPLRVEDIPELRVESAVATVVYVVALDQVADAQSTNRGVLTMFSVGEGVGLYFGGSWFVEGVSNFWTRFSGCREEL